MMKLRFDARRFHRSTFMPLALSVLVAAWSGPLGCAAREPVSPMPEARESADIPDAPPDPDMGAREDATSGDAASEVRTRGLSTGICSMFGKIVDGASGQGLGGVMVTTNIGSSPWRVRTLESGYFVTDLPSTVSRGFNFYFSRRGYFTNYLDSVPCPSGDITDVGIVKLHSGSGSSTRSIHLRSVNGQYVVAENAGGGAVNANRPKPQGWETFQLIDHNGGELSPGDKVSLRTDDGRHYVAAEHNGGGAVNAHGTSAGPWETFTIVRLSGWRWGGLRAGDKVALKTFDGRHYLGAEHGGGGVVNAHGPAPREWETFTLEFDTGWSIESEMPERVQRVLDRAR